MAKLQRLAGSTGHILEIFVQDTSKTDGSGLAGLAYNTSGLTAYYKRNTGTASAAVALANITTLGTYASGGFKEVDPTNMPGVYEFHPPDAAYASGAKSVVLMLRGATNMAPVLIEAELTAVDNQNAATFGISALPNAAPNANGGLPILSSSGTTLAYTVSTLTTYTGNTPQTGDNYARIGAAGAGLTAIGDTRLAHLDADVSSRSTFAGGSVASVTGNVGGNVIGSVGSVTGAVMSVSTPVTVGGYSAGEDPATLVWGAASRTLSAFAFSVTVGANNDKAGYSLLTAPPTAAAIASAVWQDTTAGDFTTAGSPGEFLLSQLAGTLSGSIFTTAALANAPSGGSGGATAGQIATAVWQDLLSSPDFTTAGSVGAQVAANLDAKVSSRSTYAGGAVASVTAPVTVGANNDKAGYSLASTPIAANVTQVNGQPATTAAAGLIVTGTVTAVSGPGAFSVAFDRAWDGNLATLTGGRLWLTFTSGANHGLSGQITGGTLASSTAASPAFASPFTNAPAIGDTWAIVSN